MARAAHCNQSGPASPRRTAPGWCCGSTAPARPGIEPTWRWRAPWSPMGWPRRCWPRQSRRGTWRPWPRPALAPRCCRWSKAPRARRRSTRWQPPPPGRAPPPPPSTLTPAPRVLRRALGDIDLQADLGMACGPEQAELAPLRWAMVLASRRAALAPPIDGVTTARGDAAALTQDTARSRRFGFAAKLCIHPAQIAVVHAAFAPGARECDWARRVLAAAEAAGGGVCVVDGGMVDAPVIALARQTLRRQA